jgi:hypothetical protein
MKAFKKVISGLVAAVSIAVLAVPVTGLAAYNSGNRSYVEYDYVKTSYYVPVTKCDYYGCYTSYTKKYKTTRVQTNRCDYAYSAACGAQRTTQSAVNVYRNGYSNGYTDGYRGYSYNSTPSYNDIYTNRTTPSYTNSSYYNYNNSNSYYNGYNNYNNRSYSYNTNTYGGYYNNQYGNRNYSAPYNSYYTSYYY